MLPTSSSGFSRTLPKVYVARHGETTWNLAGRYQGRRESALSALGVRQGIALAGTFTRTRSLERIVSSPLLRCVATAKFVADALDLEVETDDRLIEIAHGTWEGRLRDEIAANDPARYRDWRENPAHVAFEGGETLAGVQARWREFAEHFDGSRETARTRHPKTNTDNLNLSMSHSTVRTYLAVIASKKRLNTEKTPFFFFSWGRSSKAHSAGLRVRALIALNKVVKAIVKENCMKPP